MKEYTFVFDVDGTLCPIKEKGQNYEDLVPYADVLEKLRDYKKQGAKIVLYTSRNMNTYKGDIEKIMLNTKPILEAWLKKWEIPYDEVIFGKAWPGFKGFYVDDRTVRPREFLTKSVEELEELCAADRF